MITVTEKIENYVKEHFGGHLDGAIGSSLGSSFVGQLIQRENIHIDHGISAARIWTRAESSAPGCSPSWWSRS